MAQKIYYDAVNNKQVVDVSGVKDEAKVRSEFGLDQAQTQIIEIDETAGDTHYIDNGTLKKKTGAQNQAEQAAAAQAAANAKQGKETALKAKLGLTDQEFEDLKSVM